MQYLYRRCYIKLANTFSGYRMVILKMYFAHMKHMHGFHAVISELFHDMKQSGVCSWLLQEYTNIELYLN